MTLAFQISAQDTANRQLSITVGPGFMERQDLIFSPFIHQDLSILNVDLKYEKDKKVHQYLRLHYSGFAPGIETPYDFLLDGEIETAHLHSFTFGRLDYGQGIYLGDAVKKNSVVGASLKLDVQALNYQYGRASFFGYYSTVGLGLWYKHTLTLNKNQKLIGQLEAPLLSWYARSPYLVNDDEFIDNIYSHSGLKTFFSFLEDGELASWDKLQTVNASLSYQYAISTKWMLGATYQFAFVHAKEPKPLTVIQHHLGVTVGFKL